MALVAYVMSEPYFCVSTFRVLAPAVTCESTTETHEETLFQVALSVSVYVLVPQRPVRLLAVSTVSPGTGNSAVAVAPSTTLIALGVKVMLEMVALLHGLPTAMVTGTSFGVKSTVLPWSWFALILMAFFSLTV